MPLDGSKLTSLTNQSNRDYQINFTKQQFHFWHCFEKTVLQMLEKAALRGDSSYPICLFNASPTWKSKFWSDFGLGDKIPNLHKAEYGGFCVELAKGMIKCRDAEKLSFDIQENFKNRFQDLTAQNLQDIFNFLDNHQIKYRIKDNYLNWRLEAYWDESS